MKTGPLILAALALSGLYLWLRRGPAPAAAAASGPEAMDLPNFSKLPPKPSLPKSPQPGQASLPGQASTPTPAKPAPAFNGAAWVASQAAAGAPIRAAAAALLGKNGPANFHASSGFNSDSFKRAEWAQFVADLNSAADALAGELGGGGALKLQQEQVE